MECVLDKLCFSEFGSIYVTTEKIHHLIAKRQEKPRFHPSHNHIAAKQLMVALSALSEAVEPDVFEEIRMRILEHRFGELAAFLLREDYTFTRNSTYSQRTLAKLGNLNEESFEDI